MSAPRYRTWRFAHPDFEMAELSGLRLAPTGKVEMVEEHASIRQAVLLLLTTTPGERVMRPDYGCELHRLLFSSNDDTTAGLAIHYVRRALERWEPRINVLHLDATRSSDEPHRLDISLEYRVRATGRTERLAYPFSLAGGPT
ncbi:GPW/gp25 family protein [Pyxidicoccus parkwayensis]|uniref:GPW/gp25 family protein n=1 Tax=Pyxidicoccus parkwayensis TaxID=2813578 RepID=A0ABX7NWH0_9BACT|nr:GPW/gp25 family protein [Pyxidicoccus parkwaysis]QSQ23058.1 GPW/gp25 family protein [Pyxidicoccus parkwaysis]